jgi:hypothetical protein
LKPHALSSRSADRPGSRTLREGCETLVREWRELGEIGLSAKVAAEQLPSSCSRC